jgi:GR25 family glycosyltransferase involved in LPS biosynthesis
VGETDPFLISRYRFYLAQSYRDCGQHQRALDNYLIRADLGYWPEEVFVSLYFAAKLQDELGFPEDEVLSTFKRATDAVPSRAEGLHGSARYCRSKGRNEEGFQFARRGAEIAKPPSGLFVEDWIYDYGLLDELAVNAYWSDHHRESLDACVKLLAGTALPESQRERIAENAKYALGKLPGPPALGEFGQSNLLDQHGLIAERPLRSKISGSPKVLLAILAKQKAEMLPLFLQCIEAQDYPKNATVLYIRTNNNTDNTEQLLRDWVDRVGHLYAAVEFDSGDVDVAVEQFAAHEWNPTRFNVLGRIRQESLAKPKAHDCQFYFVVDVDNFIRANTISELVALNLPIVSPLLRSVQPGRYYSNYHAEVDEKGYYRNCDQYMWILNRWVRGLIEVPLVHTTYMIRQDVIDDLHYLDETDRYEYVIFSDSARKAKIPQYMDNRQVYGYIAFGAGSEHFVEGGIETVRGLIEDEQRLTRQAKAPVPASSSEPSPSVLPAPETTPRSTGKRHIRLREFQPNSDLVHAPGAQYLSERDASLTDEAFPMTTDADGLVLPAAPLSADGPTFIVIGDSVVESVFSHPQDRFCSRLQDLIRAAGVLDANVLNAGYSGATSLHSLNVILNKLVPLKPAGLIMMSGIVDVDVAHLSRSYWNTDCWLEPLATDGPPSTARDSDKRAAADWTDRQRILTLISKTAEQFGVPFYFCTIPHRQVFSGEYVEKAFASRHAFDQQVAVRRAMNEVTRQSASSAGNVCFDLETVLQHRDDIFYDMFHLNSRGGPAAAEALMEAGLMVHIADQAKAIQTATSSPGRQANPRLVSQQELAQVLQVKLINLDRSTARLQEFGRRNSHLGDVERVPAVDGATLDLDALRADGTITADLTYSRGAIGCALSHIGLWKRAVSENRFTTIFEDDVVASRDFQMDVENVLRIVSGDWDIIQWGYNFDPLFAWVDFGFAKANLRFYDTQVSSIESGYYEKPISSHPHKLMHSFGLQAYTVSPEGAAKLLETCLPLTKRTVTFPGTGPTSDDCGIDVAMNLAYPQMKGFICLPPSVVHDDGVESDRLSI